MSVVTLSVNDSTRGTVTGGGTYSDGTQITVTATANSGSLFACWSIGEMVVSSNPSYTFSVSGNVTLKAHFYSEIDGVKIYGICDANCRHRILSIGQVISLIQEMAANGWQVPTGYIPKTAVNTIVEQSTGKELKLFINTQKVWNEYSGDKTDMLFLPTDDTTIEDFNKTLANVDADLEELTAFVNGLKDGSISAKSLKLGNEDFKFSTFVNGIIDIGESVIPYNVIYSAVFVEKDGSVYTGMFTNIKATEGFSCYGSLGGAKMEYIESLKNINIESVDGTQLEGELTLRKIADM